MSQMSATARAGLRAPARDRRRTTPPLRVVTGGAARQGSAGFVLLCTGLLVATMLALLVLNTSRAEASFRLSALQSTSGRLADAENSLRADLAMERSPAHLATRAKALGMVPSQTAAFIRTSDGKVLGVATKATPNPDFTVVHDADPTTEAAATDQAGSSPDSVADVAAKGASLADEGLMTDAAPDAARQGSTPVAGSGTADRNEDSTTTKR